MSDQITNNPEALRLFFTDDIFLVDATQKAPAALKSEEVTDQVAAPAKPVEAPAMPVQSPAAEPQATEVPQATVTIPDLKIPAPAKPDFKYVGANQKHILILVNDAQHPVSTLKGRELLGNILKSINLNRNDCALVNYASCGGAGFAALAEFFQPRLLFAFGVLPAELGLSEATQNSIVQQDACKIIFSSNLDPLSDDPATKKQLWTSLKQINL